MERNHTRDFYWLLAHRKLFHGRFGSMDPQPPPAVLGGAGACLVVLLDKGRGLGTDWKWRQSRMSSPEG